MLFSLLLIRLPELHIIVIGGGIGGLCLAQGLKAAGVSVTIYERNSAAVWPEGYRIHINPLGSQALHACLPPVLWEAFIASAGKPPAGLGFFTEQLEELLVIAEEFMLSRTGRTFDAHYPVSRIASLAARRVRGCSMLREDLRALRAHS